jgi:DNA helicase II / ATP-dependent DNA helicase PcrA
MITYKEYLKKQDNYLELLTSLSTFVQSLRKYKTSSGKLLITDVLEYIDLMDINKLSLNNSYIIQKGTNPVQLMTAHSSKGLEFDNVFVVNCSENNWNDVVNNNKIGDIKNLDILPEKENRDDSLRLFYVALTRAKKNLYLTANSNNELQKKEIEILSYLDKVNFEQINSPINNNHISNTNTHLNEQLNISESISESDKSLFKQDLFKQNELKLQNNLIFKPLNISEKDFFAPILKNYKMSVTHLNNFLDITGRKDSERGGPKKFLEINLLRFPQSKHKSSAFGTSMHEAVNYFYRKRKSICELKELHQEFEKSLLTQRLSEKDFKESLDKGYYHLTNYHKRNYDKLANDCRLELEYDFLHENVLIDQAHITGKIDKMTFDNTSNFITVTDFKTGKALHSWKSSDNKIKLDRYTRQLVFYKILVENSTRFSNFYQVRTGELEFLEAKQHENDILVKTILEEENEKLKQLISIVWNKIQNLDFPDTSHYPNNLDGINFFIDDLLAGNI